MKKGLFRRHFILVLVCFILALVLSSYTETFMRPPVIMLFNALKGRGFVVIPMAEVQLDDNGVPITVYPDLGPQRNPVTIAQKGLEYYEAGHYDAFLKVANWLLNNAVAREGGFMVWPYQFEYKFYGMKPPWVSALAQGLGVQTLGYAWKLTGDEKYLEVAERALGSFLVDVDNGGVRIRSSNFEGWWYEEYADIGGKNPGVLNGMISATLGVYEYWSITGSKVAQVIFEQGILAIKSRLPMYDAYGWSYYDALGNVASSNYHRIHINQMKLLFELTGDPLFEKYFKKWHSTFTSPLRFFVVRVLLQRPTEADIMIIGVNAILVFLFAEGILWVLRRFAR
jgi:hypothetical protein